MTLGKCVVSEAWFLETNIPKYDLKWLVLWGMSCNLSVNSPEIFVRSGYHLFYTFNVNYIEINYIGEIQNQNALTNTNFTSKVLSPLCTGVILSAKVVLTSASCFFKAQGLLPQLSNMQVISYFNM